MISVAFAVLFIGLAVDFSIQFGLRYKESIDRGMPLKGALKEAASGTGTAVGLAAVCAAIGFFAFVPTDYIGLSQLGIIAGVGMFIGLFATLTLLPAILALLPMKADLRMAEKRNLSAAAGWLERHARAVCWGALALGLVGGKHHQLPVLGEKLGRHGVKRGEELLPSHPGHNVGQFGGG